MIKITFKELWDCFFPSENWLKYRYLGAPWNPYKKGTIEHKTIKEFIEYVDSVARPPFFPKFILRLLHLFGSDNSIVRVRNRLLHDIERHLLDGILITDIKTKWDEFDIRIYGFFPDEIHNRVEEIETFFEKLSDKKYSK